MSDLERLLEASIEYQFMRRMLAEVTEELNRVNAENALLRRQVGKARLWADMQQQKVSMFHKPQAG